MADRCVVHAETFSLCQSPDAFQPMLELSEVDHVRQV